MRLSLRRAVSRTPEPPQHPIQVSAGWLVAALIIVLADTALATVLFTLHYTVSAILALLGGAAGVAVTTISSLHQLLVKKNTP